MQNTLVKCSAVTNVTTARPISWLAEQALLMSQNTLYCASTDCVHLPMIPSLRSVWRCETLFEDKRSKSHVDVFPTLLPF